MTIKPLLATPPSLALASSTGPPLKRAPHSKPDPDRQVSTPASGFSAIEPEKSDPVERAIKILMSGVNRFCKSTHRFDKGLEYALAALERVQRLEERRPKHEQTRAVSDSPLFVQQSSLKPHVKKNEATL